jgi:hypothetical protein
MFGCCTAGFIGSGPGVMNPPGVSPSRSSRTQSYLSTALSVMACPKIFGGASRSHRPDTTSAVIARGLHAMSVPAEADSSQSTLPEITPDNNQPGVQQFRARKYGSVVSGAILILQSRPKGGLNANSCIWIKFAEISCAGGDGLLLSSIKHSGQAIRYVEAQCGKEWSAPAGPNSAPTASGIGWVSNFNGRLTGR